VLACELRLPRAAAAAAAAIARGSEQPLAVGTANGRRFLLFCGAGVDGEVVRRLALHTGSAIGKRKWLRPILGTTLHWPRHRLRAVFDDGTVLEDLSEVLVTRVRNYGGILRMVPEIDPHDGLLHAVCFRGRGRAFYLWQGLRAFLGCMRTGPRLLHRSAMRLRIEGSAPFQIDGELGGSGDLELGVLAQRARVIVPDGRGRNGRDAAVAGG
jgi:diacylglycerol kinase family enzyme